MMMTTDYVNTHSPGGRVRLIKRRIGEDQQRSYFENI